MKSLAMTDRLGKLMKIVLTSHAFHPAVGGIETMSLLFAHEFTRRGHDVTVVTPTLNPDEDDLPFKVMRSPDMRSVLSAVRGCDALFQNNISLRALWPLLFVRRPWVVGHATWTRRMDGSLGLQGRLKRFLLRFSTGISNSRAIADDLPVRTTVIGNPYRDDVFRLLSGVARDRDLVFLGWLVSDKGAALLLQAIRDLGVKGLRPTVTFIGTGPEAERLKRLTFEWGLDMQVKFSGQHTGDDLVKLLNQHRIMVVPSIWNEPFGIVALEGIACGCAVVGYSGGGLRDAIGPCGLTFRNGDLAGLKNALETLLREPATIRRLGEAAPDHLARHTIKYVTDRYLEIIEGAVKKQKRRCRCHDTDSNTYRMIARWN